MVSLKTVKMGDRPRNKGDRKPMTKDEVLEKLRSHLATAKRNMAQHFPHLLVGKFQASKGRSPSSKN